MLLLLYRELSPALAGTLSTERILAGGVTGA